ncbi:hypothetical protein SDJN02_23751, partial [Cucurbita argyrosperma subsp. argyrosperma]
LAVRIKEFVPKRSRINGGSVLDGRISQSIHFGQKLEKFSCQWFRPLLKQHSEAVVLCASRGDEMKLSNVTSSQQLQITKINNTIRYISRDTIELCDFLVPVRSKHIIA